MTRKRFTNPGDGFSLVELVAVIMIIGILAGLAMPRFSSAIAHRRVDAAAKQVLADLRWARSLARVKSMQVKVKFEKAKDKEYYRFVDMMDPDRSNVEYRVYLGKEPYMADIIDTSFGNEEVKFEIDGSCNEGSITLQVGREQRVIVADPVTGKASLQP